MLYCEDAFSHTKYESASYYESPYRKVVETIDSCPESVQKPPPPKNVQKLRYLVLSLLSQVLTQIIK